MKPDRDEPLAPFPVTQWSLVEAVRAGDEAARREALGRLLMRYLPALRAYLRISRRMEPESAADALQSFVANKVLARDLFARADQARGKFRTFLLTALQHFLIDRARKDHSAQSIDSFEQTAEAAVPRNEFDVAWARQVLKESLRQTEQHCQSWGRMDLWEVLRARVIAPAFDGTAPQPYEQLAPRFGWSSAAQGSNALMTAKRLFARTLREVISEYTRDDSDVEEEIRDLRTVLSSSGARGCDLLGIT